MALLLTDGVVFARDPPTGDLIFPLRLVSGLEAARVGARTRIMMCRGEWFLDLDAGMPYLPTQDGVVSQSDAILGAPYDPVKTRAAVLRELLTVPGALSVPVLRTDFDGSSRILAITWVLRTTFGDTPIDTLTRQI